MCTALYYQNLLTQVKDVLQLLLGDYKSIIRNNDQRQYVGDSTVAYVARASGRRVIIASLYDRFGNTEENKTMSKEFRRKVNRLPAAGATKYLHGELHLVKEATFHITSNIGTELGCANGSHCEIVHVEFDQREVVDHSRT